MYEVIFHPEAIAEFDKAKDWYGKESSDLAARFKEAVLSQITIIQSDPELFQIKRSDFRESVIHDFPYLIVY